MSKKTLDAFYPVWLWLAVIFLTPVALFVIGLFMSDKSGKASEVSSFPLFILFGLFFSAPAFFTVFLLHRLLRKSNVPVWLLKGLIICSSVLLMVLTLHFIGGSAIPALMWAYGITIIIMGAILKARKTVLQNNEAPL